MFYDQQYLLNQWLDHFNFLCTDKQPRMEGYENHVLDERF